MAVGDHLLQRAYIKKIFPNGIIIFYKKNNKYIWEKASYNHPILTYDKSFLSDKINLFNPELNGRGSNKEFSKLENNIHNIFTSNKISKSSYNLIEFKETIDYGLSLVARFQAPEVIRNYNNQIDGADFSSIFNSLKNISNFYPDKNIKVEAGFFTYSTNELILSDAPVIFSTELLCYPTNFNEIFLIKTIDSKSSVSCKLLQSIANWSEVICKSSKLFLVADINISCFLKKAIIDSYEQNIYNLWE